MPWKTFFYDLGGLLHLPAILCIPVLAIGGVFGEWRILPGFALCGILSLAAGQALRRGTITDDSSNSLLMSMVTVGTAWLLISLLAAVPFLYWGLTSSEAAAQPFRGFWTAFFESMSGFTSTGLTMASDASLLPRSVQFWRTLLEWVGGVGVVVLAMAIIQPAETGKTLMAAEGREHRIGPSFKTMGRRIWRIFSVLSLLSILLFLIAGMPPWEAVNHGMTGIATGGFTVTPDSFAGYGNGIRAAAILIMLLGALSFRVYSRVMIEKDLSSAIRNVPTIVLLALFGTGAFLLAVVPDIPEETDPVAVVFQWASALGTCGFQTTNFLGWTGAPLLLLTLAMFIGGTAGSTTGGLKIDRAILVALGPIWHLRRRLSRRKGVQYYTIDGEKVKELDALSRYRGAVSLATLFVGGILIGTLVLILTAGSGFEPHQVLFEAVSAMSNVGLSVGFTDASLPWLAKLTMIVLMWMGRLEITAVLVIFGLPFALSSSRHE